MPDIRQGGRPLAALLVVCLLPGSALAQDAPRSLQAPTIAASIASAADWATTYHALKHFNLRETNPLLRPLERTPGQMIAVGAAIDAVSFSAWNMTLGEKAPQDCRRGSVGDGRLPCLPGGTQPPEYPPGRAPLDKAARLQICHDRVPALRDARSLGLDCNLRCHGWLVGVGHAGEVP